MGRGVIGEDRQGRVAGGQRLLGLSAGEEELGPVNVVPDLEGLVRLVADRLLEVADRRLRWPGVMSLR